MLEQERCNGIRHAKFSWPGKTMAHQSMNGPTKGCPRVTKTRSLSLIAIALLTSLAACNQETTGSQAASSAAASDANAGISARDGKLMLPAVAGRPGAAYFTVRNDSASPVALTGVEIVGAGKTQMHETSGGTMKSVDSLPIAPGAEIEFSPGGLHVMVFDISGGLKPGQTTDLTLIFANGEKLKMPVMVDTIGGGDDMDGMGPMTPPGNGGSTTNGDGAPASGAMPGMHH